MQANATTPTTTVHEVPKIAYGISGTIKAYSPISAGKPASCAYARDCRINIIAPNKGIDHYQQTLCSMYGRVHII